MRRRALASILLLAMAISCVSQGAAVILCQCSGRLLLDSSPECCCEGCPHADAATVEGEGTGRVETEHCDCFVVISRGWNTYPPVSGRPQAPAPELVMGDFASMVPEVAPQIDRFRGSWKELSSTAPPGRPRALLYGSLQI